MRAVTLARCVIFAVALGLAAPYAQAGPYEDGVAAYKRGDYATAIQLWRPLAEQGRAEVQAMLGNMYAKGLGVPQDYDEAVRLCRLASDQGYARDQYNLGLMYAKGLGVPQDFLNAYIWLNLAALQGDESARENLDLAARELTAEQIAEAQRLAREWKPKKPNAARE